MIIKMKQLAIFESNSISKFKKKCIPFLRDSFPKMFENEANDALIKKIEDAIELAQQFGFKQENSIQRILFFMIAYDLQYEREFSFNERRIIESKGTPEDMRIDFLEKLLKIKEN